MQPDERIQDEQSRLELLDGLREALAVGRGVKSERGRGDDIHGQRVERHAGAGAEAGQAGADHGQRIFGREKQCRAGARHRELAQTRRAGGHADGQIQSEEGFAALGFAAQDAHGLLGPEVFDQPAGEGGGVGRQLAGALNREGVHDFLAGLGSRAKTSK